MIEVRGIKKSFDEQVVLNGVDLDVQKNETLVILGPSGQGKTVLIKSLVRLLEVDAGSVLYDGQNIFSMSRTDLFEMRKKIAFVFQNSALFDFMSVYENLCLFSRMHKKMKDREIQPLIEEALEFVGLQTDVLDKYPEELSGGMRKRVAIARAFMKHPEYIFYDEPTTGLDKSNAEKVSELILLLKEKLKSTSVVVTHDIQLMRDVADKVALLKAGKIAFVGTKEDITHDLLESLYTGGELDEL